MYRTICKRIQNQRNMYGLSIAVLLKILLRVPYPTITFQVPLRVEMTSNVVVRNLHFRLPFLNAAGSSTAPCPDMKDWLKEWVCPAVMIYGSWGIQFTGVSPCPPVRSQFGFLTA